MLVLGFETSCDETSVAVVEDGCRVKSNAIASSRKQFETLGGVVPEEAARRQVECMIPVIEKALAIANVEWTDIDAIAVTRGPGLLGSLLVGTATARMLSAVYDLPLIGVHHTLGHLSSTWLDAPSTPQFPCITLSVSGGHSDVWLRESHTRGHLLGHTRDDAAGEAFDKGASVLGLPYPGGPSIAKAADGGNISAYDFPHPLRGEDGCDFSFSGLKTALKYLLRDLHIATPADLSPVQLRDIAASFQHAICLHLLDRLERAIDAHPQIKELHIVGGVSANTHLRERAAELCSSRGITLRYPVALSYCTDNAAMIGAAGYFLWQEDQQAATRAFATEASLSLQQAHVATRMPAE